MVDIPRVSADVDRGVSRSLRAFQKAARIAPTDEKGTIAAAVERLLRSTGYHSLSFIHVEFCEGDLILRGRVPTFYLKQLAQEYAKTCPGVLRVDNRIQVTSK